MTEMEEEPKESPKHDINSYVSPVTTSPTVTSSADSTADMPPNTMRPQNAPRMVRSADHLNIAQQKQVEGKEARASVHAQHIVKIFARDDEEFIEGILRGIMTDLAAIIIVRHALHFASFLSYSVSRASRKSEKE